MTTTRPTVHFREPQDSSFESDLVVTGKQIQYSSLQTENSAEQTNWEAMGVSLALSGVVLLLVIMLGKKFLLS